MGVGCDAQASGSGSVLASRQGRGRRALAEGRWGSRASARESWAQGWCSNPQGAARPGRRCRRRREGAVAHVGASAARGRWGRSTRPCTRRHRRGRNQQTVILPPSGGAGVRDPRVWVSPCVHTWLSPCVPALISSSYKSTCRARSGSALLTSFYPDRTPEGPISTHGPI